MRPESSMYETGYGIVTRVYPETWEVDLLSGNGGFITRAVVLGPRLPELNKPPFTDRPQYCLYWHSYATAGAAWCLPISSRLFGTRRKKADYVWYDEVQHYRMSIDRGGNLEIITDNGDLKFRIEEKDGVIRLQTPDTTIVLTDADGSIFAKCKEKVTVQCRNLDADVAESVKVKCTDAEVQASASIKATTSEARLQASTVTVNAGTINLHGTVNIVGLLNVT